MMTQSIALKQTWGYNFSATLVIFVSILTCKTIVELDKLVNYIQLGVLLSEHQLSL